MPIQIKYAPALEADTYEATVTALEERVSQKTGGPYHWWEFTTDDGRTISAVTGMSFGPKAKAGQWAAALLGRTPELNEMVELVGLPCLIGVTIGDDGFSQVSSLLGRKKKPKAVKPFDAETPATRAGAEADEAEAQHAAQEDQLPF